MSGSVMLGAMALAASVAASDLPLTEQGYCGLLLRDIPSGHTVVSWIYAGPLDGKGTTSPTLCRPDMIVAVNGEAMNAERFREYVIESAPGREIVIALRRSNARGPTIPASPDHAEQIETITVTLESREEWTGTMGRGHAEFASIDFDETMLDARDGANVLGAAIDEHGLREPVERLLEVVRGWPARDADPHMLRHVRAGFEQPFALPELATALTSQARRVRTDPARIVRQLACDVLGGRDDVAFRAEMPADNLSSQFESSLLIALSIAESNLRGALGPRVRELEPEACLALLRAPAEAAYLGGARAEDHIRVIRSSLDLDVGRLHAAFDSMMGLANVTWDDLPDDFIDAPEPLRGAIGGRICSASFDERLGWIVIGSREDNRYDMAVITAVVDPGGDDEYTASDLRIGNRAIIDLEGDDVYTGTADQGPGGAFMGVSIIDDRLGNDRYEGELLSCGAAMFGCSLLLDHGGHDTYIGRQWSIGAACYGAGVLIDLGSGDDTYLGDFLCEGVGGPRGLGCIIDDAGRDLYRANGPTPSAYDTPAVYKSFSQGMGFGFRHYAAGGIGMIIDLAGDDRYEAGEFAQGGAYYYGLGILYDARGRDIYYGNRYGQGFGVHQAVGALIDDEGDDTYWSMSAASQGAAWDIGVGLLLDRAGHDSYQCDGLGQGGAANQAIAMLIDLGGSDRYAARGGAVQGESGDNSYHFHETGATSFSLLLDVGAEADWYSTGRANDGTTATLTEAARRPHAGRHGLCIDGPQSPRGLADERE